uniref:F-box domain-containing protein n=1 Tax=Heterorhabditis bacteriophora TaxID=37862 RepID=A0A1I7XDT4_HETBA
MQEESPLYGMILVNGFCSFGENDTILPPEILVKVFKQLPASDVTSSKLLNKKVGSICRLIKNNNKYLARHVFDVKLTEHRGQIVIIHSRSGQRHEECTTFENFDLQKWDEIEIGSLELKNIVGGSEESSTRNVLVKVRQALKKSRQFGIRSLSLKSVVLDGSFASVLTDLFELIIASCTELLFSHCILPNTLTPHMIEQLSVFDHYRWIDSQSCEKDNSNDLVLRKFTSDMRVSESRRSFLAEVNSVTPSTVCEFIEVCTFLDTVPLSLSTFLTWLVVSTASYFNLTLNSCDEVWKDVFLEECRRRNLTHYCLEFTSKSNSHAHIKVNFVEESQMCRIWPIFDVPARSAGSTICYARYFRDF